MLDWEKILNQLAAVAAAPIPFTIAVLIATVFIWWLMRLIYSTVISHRDAEIVLLKGQRDDYKEKLAGASPDEAKAKIEALEARLARLEPRRLNGPARSKFIEILRSKGGSFNISVLSEMGTDAQQYGADFTLALQSAGNNVTGGSVMGLGDRPPSGIGLHVKDLNKPPAGATAIARALHDSGIPFDMCSMAYLAPDAVELLICMPISP